MNNFDYKNMTPFKWFVLENFPFIENDFDAINNYHLFSKVVEYLNKTIDNMNLTGEQMENVTNAMTELQNYVNNYFDTLDVQEEVNNKLDEMAEDGTLDEIIGQYINSYTPRIYNTCEIMKNAPLETGMKIITLGYHNINDGGNANYIITDTEPSSYYERLQNGLYAKLIILDNKINPQMFGAYGNGVDDDTIYIQNCIDFAENIVLNNNSISNGEPLIELFGTYKITNTIIFSPYLTYNLKGDVTIISHLTQGTAVQIKYRNVITNDNAQNKSNGWTRGDMFFGGNLFITNNENTINENVNGLEIGNNTNIGTYQAISRGRIQNISVTYFNIGVKINAIHLYIQSFYNIITHNNNTDMQIGNEGEVNIDSGENILFQNCLFGTANNYGFNTNISSMNYTFNNCSFDYNKKGAIRMFKNATIKLDSCHIEDCQAGGDIEGIIGATSDSVYSQVELNNVLFVNANNTTPLISGKHVTVILQMLRESLLTSATDYMTNKENFYLSTNSIINSKESMLSNLRMTAPKCNEFKKYTLEDENIAPIVNNGTTKWIKYSNATNGSMQISNVDNENVINITANETNNFNCEFIIDEQIPITNPYKSLAVSYLYKMSLGNIEPRIVSRFYDQENNFISQKTWTGNSTANRLNKTNDWHKPLNIGFIDDIPLKTKFVQIRLMFIAREYCPQLLIKQLHCETK